MAEKSTFENPADLTASFASNNDSHLVANEPFTDVNGEEEENEVLFLFWKCLMSIIFNFFSLIKKDPTVCEICLDGEVFDENEIIFCDKCDVPVHQLCYSLPVVPEGSW